MLDDQIYWRKEEKTLAKNWKLLWVILFWFSSEKTNKIFLIFSLLARGKEHTHTHYYHHHYLVVTTQNISIVIRCLCLRLVLFFFSLENYKKLPSQKFSFSIFFFLVQHIFSWILIFPILFQNLTKQKKFNGCYFSMWDMPPFLFLHCSRPSSSATITILLLLLPLYIYTYIYINVETGSFS